VFFARVENKAFLIKDRAMDEHDVGVSRQT